VTVKCENVTVQPSASANPFSDMLTAVLLRNRNLEDVLETIVPFIFDNNGPYDISEKIYGSLFKFGFLGLVVLSFVKVVDFHS
jgi:hypothetical protein